MYSSLMVTFEFMAPIHHIYGMSSRPVSSERYVTFHTYYFNNPWTLPSSAASFEGQPHTRMSMPLSATEIAYQVVLDSSVDLDPDTSLMDEEDLVLEPVWTTSVYATPGCDMRYEWLYPGIRSIEFVCQHHNEPTIGSG
jgi:hypothetical protein